MVSFDNGRTLRGRFTDGSLSTIVWAPTSNTSDVTTQWSRQNATAVVTSLSLSACRGDAL